VDDVQLPILAEAITYGLGIENDRLAALEPVALMEIIDAEALRIGSDEYRLAEEELAFVPYPVLRGRKRGERIEILPALDLSVGLSTGIGKLPRVRAASEGAQNGSTDKGQKRFHGVSPARSWSSILNHYLAPGNNPAWRFHWSRQIC